MSIYDKASLVLIPSGTKTSKVYSQKPTNGDGDFTFSRSTAATRVNASGNIEKETSNLLLQSNQFDTTWNNVNVTLTSGQSGYDGSSNAWKLVGSTNNVSHNVNQGYSISGVITLSVYVKPSGYNYMLLYAGNYGGTFFDIANGTTGNNLGTTPIDANIESAGNGWYKVSISVNNGVDIGIFPSPDGTSYVYSGDGTSGILIQDAQVEQGLVARDYIETTTTAVEGGITDNVPRLDYTDSSCPALLLEPQRTNRFAHSEYSGGFNSGAAIAITNNQAISPEGLQNAFKIEKTANGYAYLRTGLSASAGCLSVFAKKGNYRYIGLRNNQINGTHSTFDFDTETFVVVASGQTCTFEDYGNGWYRLTAYQPNNEGSIYQGIAIVKANGSELVDSSVPNGSHFFVYGLQNEQGSYATSYIPTYGSAVTRNQDDITTTFSSAIPTTGNVSYLIHLDGSDTSGNATGTHAAIRFQGNDYITYNATGGGYHRIRVNVNGNSNYYSGNIQKSQEAKILAVINGDYIKIFMNGQQVNQGTLSDTPDMLSATNYSGNTNDNLGPLPIKELLLISTALTDQEAIDLTTI